MSRPTTIAVVGSGIIGISTAYCLKLQHPEYEVKVIADVFPPNTTSDIAAGLWKPHLLGGNDKNKIRGEITFEFLRELWRSPEAYEAGMIMHPTYQLHTSADVPPAEWKDIVYGYRPLTHKELLDFNANGKYKCGYEFVSLSCQASRILPLLMRKFLVLGGRFEIRKVNDLMELKNDYDIVINCSGLGARELVNDTDVFPIRGQVTKAWAPWVCHAVIEDYPDDRVGYYIPNSDWLVLGGTQQRNEWNTSVLPADDAHIRQSTMAINPTLKYARSIKQIVGLRPARSAVRLERELIKSQTTGDTLQVIHNYGHGGSGLTLFWGCALDALKLVEEILQETKRAYSKL